MAESFRNRLRLPVYVSFVRRAQCRSRSVGWLASIEPRVRGIVGPGRGEMAKPKSKVRRARRTLVPPSRARGAGAQGRAVEAALAGIAHDIRTPLTGIVALAELLGLFRPRHARTRMGGGDQERCRPSCRPLHVHRRCGQSRCRDLCFATSRSRRARLRSRWRGACRAREQQGACGGHIIAGDLPVTVLGDALRLRAALENLADNAVKFTDVGSVLFAADVEQRREARAAGVHVQR